MHEQLEIIMPPTDDVKAAVTQILEPFNEQGNDEDGNPIRHGFWDFWVIGGRFAGAKFEATLNQEKLEQFHEELRQRAVTVSSFTAGKQELAPATQIPMVDALWNEFFPETKGGPCPLFKHSNDQYKSDSLLPDDVMHFWTVPETLKCFRVIFAGPGYRDEGIKAHEMLAGSLYNGCTYQKTEWDGTFKHAVELFTEQTKNYGGEWREKITPKDDWLVVTVDYHT